MVYYKDFVNAFMQEKKTNTEIINQSLWIFLIILDKKYLCIYLFCLLVLIMQINISMYFVILL